MKRLLSLLFAVWMAPGLASGVFENLSLEEKVGQLLIVHFHGDIANEDAETLVQEIGVGGVIYYKWANGLTSPEQVQALSRSLQELSRTNAHPIPLFLTVDQEGGVVTRLSEGFTVFPGNKALGMAGDALLAEKSAEAMGEELRAVGINMNLAPVVDINCNPRNPVIGLRSFGEEGETVFAFAKAALEGYTRAGVMTVLKHFPGHGDVEIDSHEDLPIVSKSKEVLEQGELRPFAELASSADAIMTAHLLVPGLDAVHCSTLSKDTLDYLKKDIGFDGVIIADSLVMEGVLKRCKKVEEAAICAFNAGCDLLMLGGRHLIEGQSGLELSVADVQRIHHALVEAVKQGRITEERLEEALTKIRRMKERYSDSFFIPSVEEIRSLVATEEHKALAKAIATSALRIFAKDEDSSLPSLAEQRIAIFAPKVLQDAIQQASLFRLGKEVHLQLFQTLSPSVEEKQQAFEIAEQADCLLLCACNAWKYPAQEALFHSLLSKGKPALLLITRDPLDASLFPEAAWKILTFSPTAPSLEAVCDYLEGK